MLQGTSKADFPRNNKTQRLCRHRKALPRRVAERRTGDLVIGSRVAASTAERKVIALNNTRRSINSEMPPPTRRAKVVASEGVIRTLRNVACADVLSIGLAWEEQRTEKGAKLANINVPASSEVRLMAASIKAARGDCKEK